MDQLAAWAIEHACHTLVNRYAELMDVGPPSTAIDLFSANPSLTLPNGQTQCGREAVLELFLAKESGPRVTVHSMSNIIIRVIDANTATGTAVFTLYDANRESPDQQGPMVMDGPAKIGRYQDSFIRTADGWRFESRRFSLIFERV